mgnify:CR=1 FL=1
MRNNEIAAVLLAISLIARNAAKKILMKGTDGND